MVRGVSMMNTNAEYPFMVVIPTSETSDDALAQHHPV